MRILLPLVIFVFSGCGSLFWRDSTSFQSVHWLDQDRIAECALHFQEKDSLDPTAGTTRKKGFATEFRIFKKTGTQLTLESSKTVPGQQIGGVFQMGNTLVSVLTDEAANPATRRAISYDLKSGSVETLDETKGTPMLMDILPSPDRRVLILVYEVEKGNYQLRWRSPETLKQKPVPVDIQGGNLELSWSRDSSRVLIHTESVMEWDGKKLIRAKSFPRCFAPSTRYSGATSESGTNYYRSSMEEAPELKQISGWVGFDKMPFVSDVKEIGVNCP